VTLRAYLITLRGRIRETMCPDLARLRQELEAKQLRIDVLRVKLADHERRLVHQVAHTAQLMHECDGLRKEVERLRHSEQGSANAIRAAMTTIDNQVIDLARLRAEVERLRAELARLTTLRPASEHDSREHGTVRWLYRTSLGWTNCGTWQARPVAYATHWTPLPDVKEPK